ncbi:hypothetical protein F5X99DRAFT_395467 [Biscogniauxia marginata]|nr:hypothetical protein F5X99DRAFT_395467 [Biscogniauxia marginata]
MAEPTNTQEKGKSPSAAKATHDQDTDPEESTTPERFPPEEEASLLGESNDRKSEANALFTSTKYENAINKYEEAASICPYYLDYELAVLKSNIAACHLKLEQYKEAIKSATESLDGLSRVEKAEFGKEKDRKEEKEKKETREDEEAEEEIVSSGAQKSAPSMKEETPAKIARRKRHDDILRIRAKALMRRARARSELGGWSDLSGAEEDYRVLMTMKNLTNADERIVRTQLRSLPPRVKAAQEKEMSEMWGKLKDVSLIQFSHKDMSLG